MGTPAGFEPRKACFKRSCWFVKQHKTDAFTKLVVSGSGASELHVPHEQCMTSISEAVSAFSKFIFYRYPSIFVTGSPVPPTKACLCATPAGTYRVQCPGFPKRWCSFKRSIILWSLVNTACQANNLPSRSDSVFP